MNTSQFETLMILKYGSMKKAIMVNAGIGIPRNAAEKEEMDNLNEWWEAKSPQQQQYMTENC